MAKTFRLPKGELLLDIASYARGGMRPPDRLTPAQVEQVRRTVQRVPEAVVKVLPRNSNGLKAASKHLDYIGRHGELELEGDSGERPQGRMGNALLEDWDLDLDDVRRQSGLAAANGRKPPKLIHKLMFSMPPGTPPDKVLGAVRNFAREQFALQHRYAFVLHTDEPHPHVHLVLKAVSEQGIRLNIKKATLRHWRSEFARNLRLLGVPANATERAVRGETRKSMKDGIHRASLRGDSTYLYAQVQAIANELLKGEVGVDPGKHTLLKTRQHVVQGWLHASRRLHDQGQADLAGDVQRFVKAMRMPMTDRERIAASLDERARAQRTQELGPTR